VPRRVRPVRRGQACNNGLAHLDQAVIDDFDLFAFISGIPRKRGRPAQIRGVMHLTDHAHDVECAGQASADEAEITPEMIEAGVSVLASYEEFDRWGPTGEEILVRKILEASLAVASATAPGTTRS
jgi:hypothetical protein